MTDLEKTLRQQGTATCPNADCTHSLVSERRDSPNGGYNLVYWCPNTACPNHKQTVTHVSVWESLRQDIMQQIGKTGKLAIGGMASLLILLGTFFGDTLKGWVGLDNGQGKRAATEQAMQGLREELSARDARIAELEQRSPGEASGTAPADTEALARLRQERDSLRGLLAELVDKAPAAQDDPEYHLAYLERQVRLKRFAEAEAAARAFIANEALLAELSAEQRQEAVELVAHHYDFGSRQKGFTFYLLLQCQDGLALIKDVVEKIPNSGDQMYLADAYFNYQLYCKPMNDNAIRQKHLEALAYYYEAAVRGQISAGDGSTLKVIREIQQLYGLFEHDPKAAAGAPKVEDILDQTPLLNARIRFIQTLVAE